MTQYEIVEKLRTNPYSPYQSVYDRTRFFRFLYAGNAIRRSTLPARAVTFFAGPS